MPFRRTYGITFGPPNVGVTLEVHSETTVMEASDVGTFGSGTEDEQSAFIEVSHTTGVRIHADPGSE